MLLGGDVAFVAQQHLVLPLCTEHGRLPTCTSQTCCFSASSKLGGAALHIAPSNCCLATSTADVDAPLERSLERVSGEEWALVSRRTECGVECGVSASA